MFSDAMVLYIFGFCIAFIVGILRLGPKFGLDVFGDKRVLAGLLVALMLLSVGLVKTGMNMATPVPRNSDGTAVEEGVRIEEEKIKETEKKDGLALDIEDAKKFGKEYIEPLESYVYRYEAGCRAYHSTISMYTIVEQAPRFQKEMIRVREILGPLSEGYMKDSYYSYLSDAQLEEASRLHNYFLEGLEIWDELLTQTSTMVAQGAPGLEIQEANKPLLEAHLALMEEAEKTSVKVYGMYGLGSNSVYAENLNPLIYDETSGWT